MNRYYHQCGAELQEIPKIHVNNLLRIKMQLIVFRYILILEGEVFPRLMTMSLLLPCAL